MVQTRRKQYHRVEPRKTIEPNQQMETVDTIKDSQPSPNADDWKEQLNKLYHNKSFAGSYSSKLAEFIRTNETSSKFKPIQKLKFPRRQIIARFPFELFMADLLEYPFYARINRGFKYGLVVIDCFTRMIYFKPMKKKSAETTANAFDEIFAEFDEPPINIVTDAGTEFFNSRVNKVFESYGIVHYKTPTKTRWKASMAERAIRTIKTRLAKIFYKRQNNIWYDVVDQVVVNYNNTVHSAHGFRPQDVNEESRDAVYKKLYPKTEISLVCKLKRGDKVRKIREKTQFEKGYTQTWSDEIYVISAVKSNSKVCWYKLESLNQEKVPGIWYYYQLNLVSRNASTFDRESAK